MKRNGSGSGSGSVRTLKNLLRPSGNPNPRAFFDRVNMNIHVFEINKNVWEAELLKKLAYEFLQLNLSFGNTESGNLKVLKSLIPENTSEQHMFFTFGIVCDSSALHSFLITFDVKKDVVVLKDDMNLIIASATLDVWKRDILNNIKAEENQDISKQLFGLLRKRGFESIFPVFMKEGQLKIDSSKHNR